MTKSKSTTNKGGRPLNLPRNGTMKLIARIADEVSALRHSCELQHICDILTEIFELPGGQLNPRKLSSTLSAVLARDDDRKRQLRDERVNKLRENPHQIMVNLAFHKLATKGNLSIGLLDHRQAPADKQRAAHIVDAPATPPVPHQAHVPKAENLTVAVSTEVKAYVSKAQIHVVPRLAGKPFDGGDRRFLERLFSQPDQLVRFQELEENRSRWIEALLSEINQFRQT